MKHRYLPLLASTLFLACSQETGGQKAEGDAHGPSEDQHHEITIVEAKTIEATQYAPEYIQHATNVEIITDVLAASKSQSSVFTHEGYFGPLLFGEDLRAFYIRLEPGMFLAEHPHPTESMVYTISGKWVLCSEGKRQIMEAGSLFHFGSNMPTGWEAPFREGALVLIFKMISEGDNYESFVKGLRSLADQLDAEMKEGGVFYFDQLESDHPAIVFARQNNPDFDEILSGLKK